MHALWESIPLTGQRLGGDLLLRKEEDLNGRDMDEQFNVGPISSAAVRGCPYSTVGSRQPVLRCCRSKEVPDHNDERGHRC